MHIADGFLPINHAIAWTVASAPFVAIGVRRLSRVPGNDVPWSLATTAAGGFVLLLSSLKLPSVGGSSSHPTGTALGTVLYGPWTMAVVAPPVLLLQALFMGHGGLTTLGANAFALGVAGPWTCWAVTGCGRIRSRLSIGVATVAGVLATYLTTAVQLALAHPDPQSGVVGAAAKFAAIYGITQVPLAVVEAFFTLTVLSALATHHRCENVPYDR